MVNVRYLLLKDSEAVYDKFVKNSLRPERELYGIIHGNIRSRDGEQLAIESGMLKSILEKCEWSGVTIDEINPKAGSWGGQLRKQSEGLGVRRERVYDNAGDTLPRDSRNLDGSTQ